ncbi:MAG: hypothetical protein JOY64_05660 [Alphaproteobacteria bacterium]|nr:hypothetical protein [Alphaproteobacteria bacterium]
MPCGGRFNTCFHLERSLHGNVLIDCGASSMIAIRKWQVDPNVISTIVVPARRPADHRQDELKLEAAHDGLVVEF